MAWVAHYDLPLPLGERRIVSSLLFNCRACGESFRASAIRGRPTQGQFLFVGLTRCSACGHGARFVIREDQDNRHISIHQVSRALYWLGLLGLPDRTTAEPLVYTDEVVRRSVESLGQYQGEAIPAWIMLRGQLWVYSGIHSPDESLPDTNEVVIRPGLLYRLSLQNS